MSNEKSSATHILKWILFLPIGIAIYKLSNILIPLLVYPIHKEFVMEIIYSRDFGEYTIIGPLFIFIREVFNITLATSIGIYFVPKNKKTTFIVISTIWLLILVVTSTTILIAYSNYEFTIEKLYRTFTEISAQIIGFIISGFYIWRNQNKNKTFFPNNK